MPVVYVLMYADVRSNNDTIHQRHIADWYATLSLLAGVDPGDSGPGKYPIDALDMWPVGAPRGPLHGGRSTWAAPRGSLHEGVADLFYTDVRSILMVL